MPQGYRTCVYENCKSDQRTVSKDSRISFFQFPKNPERRKLWMKLADVPANIPDRLLCLCSKHFNLKYISVNPRRCMLVGLAVPFPSKTRIETLVAPKRVTPTNVQEVEISEHSSQPNSQMKIYSIENLNDNSLPTSSTLETTDNDNALIDKQHVSKFICNGKLYVKMRMDYYKNEKKALLDKIQAYEQIIDKIRNDVLNIDVVLKT